MDSYNLFGIEYPGYVRPQSHTTDSEEGVEVDASLFGSPTSSTSGDQLADFQAVMGAGATSEGTPTASDDDSNGSHDEA
jgi:hypothetical protein